MGTKLDKRGARTDSGTIEKTQQEWEIKIEI